MRIINTKHAKSGMRIARNVYNGDGDVIIYQKSRLTLDAIEQIQNMKVPFLLIEDALSESLDIKEIVDSGLKALMVFKLKTIFEKAERRYCQNAEVSLWEYEEIQSLEYLVDQVMSQVRLNRDRHYMVMDTMCLDLSLYQHSVNTAILSIKTGLAMGMNDQDLRTLGMGALLHDIGKVMIPEGILNKPGKLTRKEFEVMKQHTHIGYHMLKREKWLSEPIRKLILNHHERLDGSGYPMALAGTNIDLTARLIAIADVFDAMVSNRVYRRHIPICKAIDIMRKDAVEKLDQQILEFFLEDLFIYPPGSAVLLNSGEKCLVLDAQEKGENLRPRLQLVRDAGNRVAQEFREIDLNQKKHLAVVGLCEI